VILVSRLVLLIKLFKITLLSLAIRCQQMLCVLKACYWSNLAWSKML